MAVAMSSLWASGSVVNLGNTPWRFTKVVKPESNLATGLDVMCANHCVAEVNDGKIDTRWTADADKTLDVDLLSVKQISSIELQFSGDSVHLANLVVELSSDRKSWTCVTKDGDLHTCIPNRVNDITTVNNTVGYAAVIVNTSCILTIDDSCRYVRVRSITLENSDHRMLQPYLSELLIHPCSSTYPDSYYYSTNIDDSQWDEVGIPH